MTRLVCRKCHSVFHRTAEGKTHLGEPPSSGQPHQPAPPARKPREGSNGFSLISFEDAKRPALAMIGLLLILGFGFFGYSLYASPAASLLARSQDLADALIKSDSKKLSQFAKVGSEADLLRWRDSIEPKIEELKAASLTSRLEITVVVTDEDAAKGNGECLLFLIPSGVQARKETEPEGKGPKRTTEVACFWTKDSSGRWMLDGQSTLQSFVASR